VKFVLINYKAIVIDKYDVTYDIFTVEKKAIRTPRTDHTARSPLNSRGPVPTTN